MEQNFDLGLLRAFITLCDELNYHRAADRLHIDQSALSRKIRRLEGALGFDLLIRNRRETILSPAGLVYLEQAKDLLRQFKTARDRSYRASVGEVGRIRVSSMSFAILDLVPRIVRRFRERFSDVEVDLSYQSTTAQRLALQKGEIDAGFMIGPYSNPAIGSIVVRDEPLVLALPLGHPLTRKEEIALSEASSYPFVLGNLENWRYFRTLLDRMCHERNVDLRIIQEVSNSMGIIGLVAANVGLTIFADCLRRLQPGAIAVRSFDDPTLRIQTVFAWQANTHSRLIANFVDVLKTSGEITHSF